METRMSEHSKTNVAVDRKKIEEAEARGNNWLAEGNAAAESGDAKKAEDCYRKGQYWLDRYNALTGRS